LLKPAVLFVCAFALSAQTPPAPQQPPKPAPGVPATKPIPQQKPSLAPASQTTLRFDPSLVDKSADPCVDFYQYACGNWMKQNPIPPDQSRWGRFSELEEHNREVLRQILEDAEKPAPNRDAISQKIGDYYYACMNEAAIDAAGLKPIQPQLDRIAALRDKQQLAAEVARLQSIGAGAMFDFGSGQDFKNSNMVIAQFDQGGLGLPDRDYYLKTDARSVEIRQKYTAHVAKMFELAGESPRQAKLDADNILAIETALAKGSLDRVSRRDPVKVYHKMSVADLEKLGPAFQWRAFFRDTGAPQFTELNVATPEFVKALNAEIENVPLDQWKTYLRWHLLHSSAPLLPKPFVDANFDFYGRTMTGATVLRPRWKRCVDYVDRQLGEALGQKYVERAFPPDAKQRTLEMVHQIEKAMGESIQTLDWMTPATKQQALIKLHAITNKIGYPEKWRDYSSVAIRRDDPLGNSNRAALFESHRELNKIDKPVDRTEWDMTPPTVNAYYDPLMNNINFPAGILQPPFYDNHADDAVNYGGIGSVIGHELTHAFDDEGSQFDAQGNLRNWWTPADAKAFQERVACIAKQYSAFEPLPGVNINGQLTLGENTADNGGARIALRALHNAEASQAPNASSANRSIDNLTPEQRYFLSFGQIWCANERPEAVRLQVQTDPHSPPRYRVNGVVQNLQEFQKAWSCKAGQPMVSANACRVW